MPDPFAPPSASSPFIQNSRIQWAWDSTSLGWLKECPRKYYYHMIEGWVTKAESVHLEFGILYHKALELYDRWRFEGLSHNEAVEYATKWALKATWRNGRPWRPSAELPAEDKISLKCREFFVRSVIWYLDKFEHDAAKVMMKADGSGPMVEMHFQFEIDVNYSGQQYALCGYLDKVVTFNELPFAMDRKTTTSTVNLQYFQQFDPDNQMSLYTLASNVAFKNPVKGVIVDAAQIKVGGTEFNRSVVQKTQEQLNEWLHDAIWWMRAAKDCAEAEYWPMNDKSCHKYGGCPFIPVCSTSASTRDKYLETKFERRKWNPLELRG